MSGIESNPVKAGIVENIADYKWSSYKERCFSSEPDLLDELRGHFEEWFWDRLVRSFQYGTK
ncbi:MAG: hypothetical protein P9L93_03155 [Candidatus Gorgyraea atricola]|nr:hypothetical protein [Candidatus Gorgyraea atricola]